MAIKFPGESPLATVIDRAGTRALLVVREKGGKGVDVLLVDVRSGKLLHRAALPHSSDLLTTGAAAGLDESRGHAVIVINVYRKVESVVFVVDFRGGLVTASFHLPMLDLGAAPVVDAMTGLLWFVAVDEHRAYLVRIDLRAPNGDMKRFDLAVVGADGGSDIAAGVLNADAHDRRLIVTWSYDPQKLAAFDLDSGRLVWTFKSPVTVSGVLQPVFDPSSGDIWIGDPARALLYDASAATGAVSRVTVGAKNQSVVRVSPASAGGVLVARAGGGATDLILVTAKPARQQTIATLKSLQGVKLLERITGPDTADYHATVYDQQVLPGTVRDFYLSYTIGGPLMSPYITSGSRLSVLDWATGAIQSRQPLPIQGDLVQGRAGRFESGFYATLGLGKRSLDTLAWEGAALLVVRES